MPKVPTQHQISLYMPIAIVIAGALIAIAIFYGDREIARGGRSVSVPNNQAVAKPTTAPVKNVDNTQANKLSPDISKVKISDSPYYGNINAPVTIAIWSDYQCTFCKRIEENALSQIVTDYVKSGKVKIVYKNNQFLGEDSQTAGIISYAVWEVAPNKFYQWHKTMLSKQDGTNSGWGNQADILALTNTILGTTTTNKIAGLIVTKKAQYQALMTADKAEGASFGLNSTPALIIGKQAISGAQPYTSIKPIIDQVLLGK